MHCPRHQALYERLKRVLKHDMDFVTYDKFRPLTKKLFVDLGYEPYITLMMTSATGKQRQIFNDKDGNKAIDVFLGKFQMCHMIDYSNRLEIDSPTVPPADLLPQELQIVQTNEKDFKTRLFFCVRMKLDGPIRMKLTVTMWPRFFPTNGDSIIRLA